tara:strand:- start:305 stop:502 length:198 start_codon:yes stop_codon:yes gene_type:complete
VLYRLPLNVKPEQIYAMRQLQKLAQKKWYNRLLVKFGIVVVSLKDYEDDQMTNCKMCYEEGVLAW